MKPLSVRVKSGRLQEAEQKMIHFHHGVTERTEKGFFVCREVPTNKKMSGPLGTFEPKVRGVLENRYLPILQKVFFLCEFCASNESCSSGPSGW
jgi:hypothetical protein